MFPLFHYFILVVSLFSQLNLLFCNSKTLDFRYIFPFFFACKSNLKPELFPAILLMLMFPQDFHLRGFKEYSIVMLFKLQALICSCLSFGFLFILNVLDDVEIRVFSTFGCHHVKEVCPSLLELVGPPSAAFQLIQYIQLAAVQTVSYENHCMSFLLSI